MMIRVLHVFAQLNMGGAENMIMNIYRGLDKSKVQFDFVENETKLKSSFVDEIRSLGGNIYLVPKYNIINRVRYEKAWNEIFEEHPEIIIVHAHHTAPAYIYLDIAKKHGRFTIAHSHTANGDNSIKSKLKKYLRRKVLAKADLLLACSRAAGEWMFGDAKYKVFPNAIEIEKFVFSPSVRESIRNMNGWSKKFVIGHVGRFIELKNHAFLIRVFIEIRKLRSDSILVLIGTGELIGEIKQRVDELGIRSCVQFLDVRSDVNELLQGFDTFVFPSLFEGLPVSLVEAQCAGLRCFVSDSVTKEVNVTELIEYISLQKSEKEWADRIATNAYVVDRTGYASQIKNAGYDVSESVKELVKLYDNLTNCIAKNNCD